MTKIQQFKELIFSGKLLFSGYTVSIWESSRDDGGCIIVNVLLSVLNATEVYT